MSGGSVYLRPTEDGRYGVVVELAVTFPNVHQADEGARYFAEHARRRLADVLAHLEAFADEPLGELPHAPVPTFREPTP